MKILLKIMYNYCIYLLCVCVTGMSYLAAVLLMQLGEEETFWALTALLDKPKYLSELFDLSLAK